MKSKIIFFGLIVFVAVLLAACAAGPTPTPVPIPVIIVPTASPQAIATSTPAPTVTPTQSPTLAPTATRPPAAPTRPPATATKAVRPGVFVTDIKLDPAAPKSEQAPIFNVTFLNTTGQKQMYRLMVKIYRAEESIISFGETSKVDREIPVQTASLRVGGDWKTLVVLGCESFVARAFYVTSENQVVELLRPDGSNPAKGFDVCPPL